MEPLYKIGDKVRVKSTPSGDYPYTLTTEMCNKYGGKTFIIKAVITKTYSIDKYSSRCPIKALDECRYEIMTEEGKIIDFNWSSPMFEKVSNTLQSLKINISTKRVKFNFNN